MEKGTQSSSLGQIEASIKYIRTRTKIVPEIAIVLGTGLGALAREIRDEVAIPLAKIPYFVKATAISHKGIMLVGKISSRDVCVLEGRYHLYEGYSPQQITYPVRVAKALGAKILIVSNAAGGLNPDFRKGDIVLIEDHINLMGTNPLIGPNDESLGPRFPDMSAPYDKKLMEITRKVAVKKRLSIRQGVYAGLTGPSLETRAEYRFLRTIGADLVGMSTIPEVIVANHAGLRVLGLSIVTDLCDPDNLHPVSVEEIIRVANEAEPRLTTLVGGVISQLKS